MYRRFPILWALAASVLCPVSVAADPAASTRVETTAPSAVEGDPRHPTTHGTRLKLEAPYADDRDLIGVLDTVPGVHTRHTSFGQTSFATIRGSNARQVSVEWEGLRLNPPFGPGFDFGGTSQLGFDEVIIWRGPAAAYRGSGAVEGAIEFRTRHLRRPGQRVVGSALLGSHDTRAASVDATVANKTVSNRVGVAARRSDGDFEFVDAQGEEARRVNNDHARQAVFGSSELRLGDATVRATVLHDTGERGTPGQSEFQHRFADARLKDSHTTALLRVTDPGRTDGARPWSVDSFAAAGLQHRVLDYSNPNPFLGGAPIEEQTDASTFAAEGGFTAWGPTSVARMELSGRHETWRDSSVEAHKSVGGLGSSWEQRLASDRLLLFAAGRGELESTGDFVALPSVGSSWSFTRELSARINAGRTYRTPDLDERYLDTETVRGNPDLEPESSWSGDVGLSWDNETLGAELGAELIAFGRYVDSAILFLPVTAYLVEAQNIHGSRAAGVEAQVRATVGRVGGFANYTLTDARFVETSEPVPLQPVHASTARVGVEVVRAPLPIEVWTRGHARSRIFLDSFGNQTAGGYLFWDAGVSARWDGVTARFATRNILDDRRAQDALQRPLPGRTLWLSLFVESEAL